MPHRFFNLRASCLLLFTIICFSSCLISSKSDMAVFNKREYANSLTTKTIKVPLVLTKPIIKKYLRREEDVPKAITDLIGSIKRVRVTIAQTKNQKIVTDFRKTMLASPGEEWFSLTNLSQFIYLKAVQNNDDVIKRLMVGVSNVTDNQLVFLNMKCNLTPDQLSTLINYALDAETTKKVVKKT